MPGSLVLDPFDNLAVVRTFQGPVLVFHGKADQIIPYEHGQALADAAPHGQLVTLQCGHNDCVWDAAFWARITNFLAENDLTPK